jgi:hypothetical protein
MSRSLYMPATDEHVVRDPKTLQKIRQQVEDSIRSGHDFETFRAAIQRIHAESSPKEEHSA